MLHLDLFSGIGGFALAVDTVWPGSEHIFCDNDKFCQQVLKKHWPNSKIYEDIRLITDTNWIRLQEQRSELKAGGGRQLLETFTNTDSERQLQSQGGEQEQRRWTGDQTTILTGGFPCQPFSQAGKRRGAEDNRFLWPEMLRVIRFAKPSWVIAENVRGLLTQGGGLVFEQVCADLEAAGYEVQPLIIPAVAVNAPHRRDRIWFIANAKCDGIGWEGRIQGYRKDKGAMQETPTTSIANFSDDPDTESERLERTSGTSIYQGSKRFTTSNCASWNQNWLEVATRLCGVDDGLPAELDGFKLSKAGHRNERLKSLGNAIVPQVAVEIMKAIKQTDEKRN